MNPIVHQLVLKQSRILLLTEYYSINSALAIMRGKQKSSSAENKKSRLIQH